jgi:DNA polymerase I
MERPKLFLLDALALIYRAHFAFIKNPRITSSGLNTSAVFGFTNSLLEVLNKEKPTHIGVAFDTQAPTQRHETFADYKAHREEVPEDIITAIPLTRKLLDALKIPVLILDGYEADDIIGTLAGKAEAAGFDVYMMTPDKDYAQLVTNHVFMYRPAAYGNGPEVYNRAKVIEKYGVPPEKIADLLGLKGDASDNIPGIPKVGDKTALELIQQFGSVEEIIRRADEITKKAVKESVIVNADLGLLSKKLATIQLDVPIEFDADDLKICEPDRDAAIALFKELEFKNLANRVFDAVPGNGKPAKVAEVDLFNQTPEAPARESISPPENYARVMDTTQVKYAAANTPEQHQALLQALLKADAVCIDTETTSTDAMTAELVGMSFAWNANEAWYVPAPANRQEALELVALFAPFWNSHTLKIGQNLKYDLMVLRNHGVEVQGPFYDTMLAHYVAEPDGKHGMDALALQYLGYEPVSITTLIGKKGKNQGSMRDVALDEIVPYACEDADITLQLKAPLDVALQKQQVEKVFTEIEMPLMPVLMDMEWQGIKIDEAGLQEYSKELAVDIQHLEKSIWSLAGEEFNINSPKQLGDIIFGKLKLDKGKKTPTGQYSTNEETLTQLAFSHDLPAKILEYRQLNKLKATYVDALPALIHPRTGRVHTTFSQAVAATGRLSSNNPNLQNIPIRTEKGREVRKAFVPADAEHVLLSADYSQIELRIMAELSGDVYMKEAFLSGEDIHRATAARVFGVHPSMVDSDMRSKAKMVNFGIIYGISAFGLSQRLGIPRGEAKEIIESYFSQYPGIKSYMDACIASAKDTGYAITMKGRKRHLADINSGNATVRGFAERNAINSPIQGTAADMIKIAMIRIHQKLSTSHLKSKMILQVHDELLFDVLKPELEAITELVRHEMMHAMEFSIPLEVGIGHGNTWLEAH